MVCPTCGNEMRELGTTDYAAIKDVPLLACPRCGTILYQLGGDDNESVSEAVAVPTLVERARAMAKFKAIDEDDPNLEEKLLEWYRVQKAVVEATTKARM